jgi:hypothetical protein
VAQETAHRVEGRRATMSALDPAEEALIIDTLNRRQPGDQSTDWVYDREIEKTFK